MFLNCLSETLSSDSSSSSTPRGSSHEATAPDGLTLAAHEPTNTKRVGATDAIATAVVAQAQDALSYYNLLDYFFGSDLWYECAPTDQDIAQQWLQAFFAALDPASPGGALITDDELTQLLLLPRPGNIQSADITEMCTRWNRSWNCWQAGITTVAQVPAGQSTDFIDMNQWNTLLTAVQAAIENGLDTGNSYPMDGVADALVQYINEQNASAGVCASVVVQLDQRVTLTRSAFNATLQINNAVQNVPLQNVSVTLSILDAQGNPADTLFGTGTPTLTNISDVSGNGTIMPGTNATACWTLIPTNDAATTANQDYTVGGSFSYTQNGTLVTVPLTPATITVVPNPQLTLDYFMVHDVYGDDPLTPQVEPSLPFPFGLIMHNTGYGTASNVTIQSAQPQIVDNTKGLPVNFTILSKQVNAQPAQPTLTVNLGNIGPGQHAEAVWMMDSPLAGTFTNYSATYTHVNPLGAMQLSLINSINVHELTHAVRVLWPADDNIPDFLVVDHPNTADLPDTLYCSDGRVEAVGLATNILTDGAVSPTHLAVHLTCTAPQAWMFLRTNDPGADAYTLLSVMRSDGSVIYLNDNVWTTHRTVHPLSQPSYPEDLLNLFDYQSTGDYTLYYAPNVPIAVAEAYTVDAGSVLTVNALDDLLANDVSIAPLSIAGYTVPSYGTLYNVGLLGPGTFSYLPDAGFCGTDTFTYTATDGVNISAPATVTITVVPVPIANPDSYSMPENTTLTATSVLANDTDTNPAISLISAQAVTQPTNGTLTFNSDGTFTYVPAYYFAGVDTFSYTASDGTLSSAPATVTITVNGLIPAAHADAYSVNAGVTLTISAPGVLGNDSSADGGALSAELVTGPSNGTLTLNADGSFSYTPTAGFYGTDSFSYTAADAHAASIPATVTITVNPMPIANPDSYCTPENTTLTANSVLANDTDTNPALTLSAQLSTPPQHGTLTFHSDGTFSYVPATNFVGTDTFSYSAGDGTLSSAPATVTITVTHVDTPPTALAGTLIVAPNTATNGFLTSLNPNGPIVYSIDQQGTLGTVSITNSSTGAYRYTPNTSAMGSDHFVFRVADAANPALYSTATVTVTVLGIALSATPASPQLALTPITLSATAVGVGTLQYRFLIEYRNPDGSWAPSSQFIDSGYQAGATFTWTPQTARQYTLVAYVKDQAGHTPMTYILYTIQPANLTGVTLSTDKISPQLTGTTITLTAAAQGGIAPADVEYQFTALYRNADGSWAPTILLRSYASNPQCVWTPASAVNYTLVVAARAVGDTAPYDVDSYILYTILPANLTGVSLSAGLPAPQVTGTAITLTAAAQGGIASGNVEYKFVAEYQLADGTWATPMLLRDYATNPMYTWTPSDPLIYTLVVYARVVGSTQPYDVYSYINYAIQPANLTGVTLTASPRAPQPTGMAITLTAAAQGGIAPANVEYKFVSEYRLTDGTWSAQTLLRDYATTPQCLWTPTLAENYTVVVYARTMGSTEAYNVYGYITYQVK